MNKAHSIGNKVTIRFGSNIPAGSYTIVERKNDIITIARDGMEKMRYMVSTNHSGIVS